MSSYTYIRNGALAFDFSIDEHCNCTVTVRNVDRTQFPGLHEGDELLKLTNHMIKKNPTGIGDDDPVINLANYVMAGDINNADARLKTLFEIYDVHTKWQRKVWLRRANTATTAAPAVATAAPVPAPKKKSSKKKKKKKKKQSSIGTAIGDVDIEAI